MPRFFSCSEVANIWFRLVDLVVCLFAAKQNSNETNLFSLNTFVCLLIFGNLFTLFTFHSDLNTQPWLFRFTFINANRKQKNKKNDIYILFLVICTNRILFGMVLAFKFTWFDCRYCFDRLIWILDKKSIFSFICIKFKMKSNDKK